MGRKLLVKVRFTIHSMQAPPPPPMTKHDTVVVNPAYGRLSTMDLLDQFFSEIIVCLFVCLHVCLLVCLHVCLFGYLEDIVADFYRTKKGSPT